MRRLRDRYTRASGRRLTAWAPRQRRATPSSSPGQGCRTSSAGAGRRSVPSFPLVPPLLPLLPLPPLPPPPPAPPALPPAPSPAGGRGGICTGVTYITTLPAGSTIGALLSPGALAAMTG